MKLTKGVIPVAGLGTRLLSATKEQPKEMLPIFAQGSNGEIVLKPLVQTVFEQLYDAGLSEFCFVVGRQKRAIEDHFTPDWTYIDSLNHRGKGSLALELTEFYRKVESSKIFWVNQPEPLGFGDAVARTEPFVGGDLFLVHAGDTYIASEGAGHLRRMVDAYNRLEADAIIAAQAVDDPRMYGVIEGVETANVVRVNRVVEKPEKPPSNLAIMPIYIFRSSIFQALKSIKPGKDGEYQLTDGIQTLIDWGKTVFAVTLEKGEPRLDIGTPETYWEALRRAHRLYSKRARG